MRFRFVHVVVVCAIVGAAEAQLVPGRDRAEGRTQYLAFQLTTYVANPHGITQPFDRDALAKSIDEIVVAVGGDRGDGLRRQLAFAVGPIAFDHSDEQVRRTILGAFQLAIDKGVAVVFHVDDSMFWTRRPDLWTHAGNREWLDWSGHVSTGRKIDWGVPEKLAPQMCFNSVEVEVAVRQRAEDVIGATIAAAVERLRAMGKERLFAGVIAGWETQIGRDFETDRALGYCALTNAGFTAASPPADPDVARAEAVRRFIELWTRSLSAAGVDREKIYSHTSFVTQEAFQALRAERPEFREQSYLEAVNFAPPYVAFGAHHHPGFSTYPAPGLLAAIHETLERHGNPPWASAEGTNIIIGLGESGMDMEGYLAAMFNHGATLVNLFGWGVGGDVDTSNPFRQATQNPRAVGAYRKFLRGEELVEPGDFVAPR